MEMMAETKKIEKEMKGETRRIERKYLSEFVYGGMDGVITTFAVVSGVIGASLNAAVILILGFANIFSDGFAIAVSDYFAIKSKNDMVKVQYKHPARSATATFFSFLMGLAPLLPFVIASLTENNMLIRDQYIVSFILTALALLVVGWFKGEVTGKHKLKSAIQTFIIGGIAAFLAFCVGRFIGFLTGY